MENKELKWLWPLLGVNKNIPEPWQAGAFGAVRKFDVHCGVDLYCRPDQLVHAVEDGRVVALDIFTGPDATPPSPWWNTTCAVYVEGKSGVVVYGEIEIDRNIHLLDSVKRGDVIGRVVTVLMKDKGLPMTMLHLELHKPGTRAYKIWELGIEGNRPVTLLNPTEFLEDSDS